MPENQWFQKEAPASEHAGIYIYIYTHIHGEGLIVHLRFEAVWPEKWGGRRVSRVSKFLGKVLPGNVGRTPKKP